MKGKRIRGKPDLAPQNIGPDTWYYEQRGCLRLIHWVRDDSGKRYRAEHVEIPWRMLLASLKRCRPEVAGGVD